MTLNFDLTIGSILLDKTQLLSYLRSEGLHREFMYCEGCNQILNNVKYKRSKDGIAFRCYKKSCPEFHTYISIRRGSFF